MLIDQQSRNRQWAGVQKMEQAMVVSGAKGYQSIVPDMQEDTEVVTVDE